MCSTHSGVEEGIAGVAARGWTATGSAQRPWASKRESLRPQWIRARHRPVLNALGRRRGNRLLRSPSTFTFSRCSTPLSVDEENAELGRRDDVAKGLVLN